MKTIFVHISNIQAGDTIMLNGNTTTVCKNNIGLAKDDLLGKSLFGDSYKSGHVLVEKVLFPRWRMIKNEDGTFFQERFYDK